MRIIIKQNSVILDGQCISLSDLDNNEIENLIKNNKEEYEGDIDEINEVFLRYAHEILCLKALFNSLNAKPSIEREKPNFKLECLVKDAIGCKPSFILFVYSKICFFITNIFAFFYMLFVVFKTKKMTRKNFSDFDSFYVSRAKQDIKMIRVLDNCEKTDKNYENLHAKLSFYSNFCKCHLVRYLFSSFFLSFKRASRISKYVKRNYGPNCAIDSMIFYSKRVFHTTFYECLLSEYFGYFRNKVLYTGDNLDRFALIQERIASENNIKIICIPHGIEYGFYLPHCFVGDLFYATSNYAAEYLNNLYATNKFIYSKEICEKMFKVGIGSKSQRKIVFFTEPREAFVNLEIIKTIHSITNNKVLLKMHPVDNLNNYVEIRDIIEICDDFGEAISNSLCVARKSTILIEALYNNSSSLAVVVNNKDLSIFNTFPSLQDERIIKVYSFDELKRFLSESVCL